MPPATTRGWLGSTGLMGLDIGHSPDGGFEWSCCVPAAIVHWRRAETGGGAEHRRLCRHVNDISIDGETRSVTTMSSSLRVSPTAASMRASVAGFGNVNPLQ